MNGLAASRPWATTSSVGAVAPPATSSIVFAVASASTIMIATSEPTTRPATTMSKTAVSSCSCVGNATHWPSMSATRVAPIGPLNGSPAIWVDADAALIASTSYRSLGSSAMTVTTTWISLRRPFTKVGRSGRSISRQVRIASSEGRPSRRKNEPGIRPAAYIRSSTSTVSGKKSSWSLGCLEAVVADRSMVSSSRYATTEPAAWRASRPVSKRTVRVPNRPLSIEASVVLILGPSTGCPPLWCGGPRAQDGVPLGRVPVFDRGARVSAVGRPGGHYRGPRPVASSGGGAGVCPPRSGRVRRRSGTAGWSGCCGVEQVLRVSRTCGGTKQERHRRCRSWEVYRRRPSRSIRLR